MVYVPAEVIIINKKLTKHLGENNGIVLRIQKERN